MTIRAILAHDAYWGIGKHSALPWPKNTDDLAWFKQCTQDSVVVMGRKTWESLPRKPLPDRVNIVIASKDVEDADICISGDPIAALNYVKEMFEGKDVWIIGGAQLLESCLTNIDELWLNNVGGDYGCDTCLPKQQITEQFYPASTETKSFGIITKWIKR